MSSELTTIQGHSDKPLAREGDQTTPYVWRFDNPCFDPSHRLVGVAMLVFGTGLLFAAFWGVGGGSFFFGACLVLAGVAAAFPSGVEWIEMGEGLVFVEKEKVHRLTWSEVSRVEFQRCVYEDDEGPDRVEVRLLVHSRDGLTISMIMPGDDASVHTQNLAKVLIRGAFEGPESQRAGFFTGLERLSGGMEAAATAVIRDTLVREGWGNAAAHLLETVWAEREELEEPTLYPRSHFVQAQRARWQEEARRAIDADRAEREDLEKLSTEDLLGVALDPERIGRTRRNAACSLMRRMDIEAMITLWSEGAPSGTEAALWEAIEESKHPAAEAWFVRLLASHRLDLAEAAADALGRIGGRDVVMALEERFRAAPTSPNLKIAIDVAIELIQDRVGEGGGRGGLAVVSAREQAGQLGLVEHETGQLALAELARVQVARGGS